MIRTPEEQHLHELIESYVAPLRSEIKALRKELAEQQVKNLNIPAVIKSVCDHPWQECESVMGDGVLCRKCNTVIKRFADAIK